MQLFFYALACTPTGDGGPSNEQYFPTEESDADTDTDSDTDADSDSDTDSDTDSDADSDTDTDFDCVSGLPTSLPYDSREIDGSATAEDLDIDNDGFIIGSDRSHLYRSNADGDLDMIMPNAGNPQAIVVLPSDDIVFYPETGQLERLAPDGDRFVVATGIYMPYGDATAEGIVYGSLYQFTHEDRSAIGRIDPFENEVEEIMDWEDDYPWGITFNENYTALYVSVIQGFDGVIDGPTRIWKVNLDDNGYPDGDPEIFVEFTGETSWTEGLAVDVCGNVYASLGTKIARISKDGETIDVIWEGEIDWGARAISGLAFGRKGEGGTDPLKLYASNPYEKYAIEIDAGVYGKSAW